MRYPVRPDGGVGHNGTTGVYGKEPGLDRDGSLSCDTASEYSEPQAGVKRIEAVSKAWTKTSLIIAYATYVLTLLAV